MIVLLMLMLLLLPVMHVQGIIACCILIEAASQATPPQPGRLLLLHLAKRSERFIKRSALYARRPICRTGWWCLLLLQGLLLSRHGRQAGSQAQRI